MSTDLSELRHRLEQLRELIEARPALAPLAPLLEATIEAIGAAESDPESTAATLQAFAQVASSLGFVRAFGGCLESCGRNYGPDIQRYGLKLATSIYLACVAVCQLFASGSGGTVVPPEPWPPVPSLPIPLPPVIHSTPTTPAMPSRCLVKVSLLRVSYSGSNEGNDWRIQTTIQGREFRFRQRTINNGDTSAFGQEVFRSEVGICGREITIDIVCKATEVDTPDQNEIGTAEQQIKITCPNQTLVRIPVTVDSAVMTFVLSIDTVCG